MCAKMAGMREIPLVGQRARGRVALVDDEDFNLVFGYQWYASESSTGRVYAVTNLKLADGQLLRSYGMHTLITRYELTDHRDGNSLNNQRYNLRPATISQNRMNSRAHTGSRTGFKGVNWSGEKTHTWQARIMKDGKRHFLGNFSTPEEAARAYDAAARELHGEFARLNFPD